MVSGSLFLFQTNVIKVAESDTHPHRGERGEERREREQASQNRFVKQALLSSQFVSESNDIKLFLTIVYTQLCMKVVNAEYIHFLFSFILTLEDLHTVAFSTFSMGKIVLFASDRWETFTMVRRLVFNYLGQWITFFFSKS